MLYCVILYCIELSYSMLYYVVMLCLKCSLCVSILYVEYGEWDVNGWIGIPLCVTLTPYLCRNSYINISRVCLFSHQKIRNNYNSTYLADKNVFMADFVTSM